MGLFGDLIGAIGGGLNASKKKKALQEAAEMSKFKGFDISGAGGNLTFGDNSVSVSPDAQSAGFQDAFASAFSDIMSGGGYGGQAINLAQNMGTSALPWTFAGAMQASDPTSALMAGNIHNAFSQGNALFGQAAGMNNLAMMQDFANRQGGFNEGMNQNMFNLGLDAMVNADYSGLRDDFLTRQRAYARPGEERAVDSKLTNLFSRGTLQQTGGDRKIGELALQQELADIQRVNSAEQLAMQQQAADRGFGLSAVSQGYGGRGMDMANNAQMANLFGNTGLGLMQFGQGASQSGFNTMLGLNELVNTRGQQRLLNTQNLLGFGAGLQNQNMNQAMGFFGGYQNVNDALRNLIALGGNLGSEQALAGARAGSFAAQRGFSPFGTFLEGFGSSDTGQKV